MVTGRKLLLADDSATIQKVVDLTFSDEGLEVITVGDGQQALEKLDEVVPDIVLADVFMPGLSGYQLCEYIKRTERFSHIPVMLLVGSFEPFDEAEARRVGADDYLTKPFQSIRTLIGKVGGLLSGGGASQEATTRQLAPPPAAEKENRPEADFLERSTADTAPLPQHEREQQREREVAFNDLSMDDELIETMPGYGYPGGGPAGTDAQDPRRTARYSAADFAEAGISPPRDEPAAPAARQQEEVFDGYSTARMSEPEPAPSASAGQPAAVGRASALASSDDALLDLGDLDTPPALVEADDFILDLQDETAQQPPAAAPFFETPVFETEEAQPPAAGVSDMGYESEAPQAYADERAEEETAQAPAYQPAAEAAPRGDSYAAEQYAPTERLPESFQFPSPAAARAEDESRTPAASAAPSGQITLEQLSPEAVEAIARRAAEMLSERVVEQIAWEVVPDLAERLIKRRLEEEKSQT